MKKLYRCEKKEGDETGFFTYIGVERSFIPSFAPIPPQNEKSCETKIVTLVK
jgi:hypothetical protein